MSIQAPQGILNIPNATLRVGKLAVDSTAGFDTVFNNVERNTILLVDSTEYDDTKQWDLKMPNIFVATFEIKGAGSSFNFRNTSNGDATVGYTLTFSGTTLTLKYDDSVPILATATIPNLDATYGKVYLTYEKQYFTVTVDGTRVLAYKDDVTRTPPDGEYINFFAGTGTPRFQNLKVVAGHLISDGTSNVSLYGGLAVTSNLEVGQANLFVDTTTSRVGVGTTTPEATLHVSGNAYVSSNLEVGSSNLFVDTVNSRVGVGTDTPKESLDVVGNMHLTRVSNVSQIKVDSNVVTEYTGPHDRPLRKYPEVAMTSASQGGYVVDKSEESSSGDAYAAYRAFDGIIPDGTTTIGWRTDSGYNQDTGLADGGVTRFTGDSGEWVELQLPNSIKLSSIVLKVGNQGNNLANSQRRFPKVFVIYGYNGTSWDRIQEYTTSAIQSLTDVQTFHISNPTAYHNKFVLVVKQTYSVTGATSGVTNIGELEYYGYEEGSGSLDTTLKSVYNVPATTGTQLEVYYDAKDLTTMPANVTDLAGGDQNGTVTGHSPTLDETNGIESFKFDGVDDYITTTLTNPNTDWVHSVSMWVYPIDVSDDSVNGYMFAIGPEVSNQVSALRFSPDGFKYTRWTGGGNRNFNGPVTSGRWHHVTLVSPGSTDVQVYLDGRLLGYTSDSLAALTLPQNTSLSVGRFAASASYSRPFKGSIANFRLYSKALNAGQVQELYDYQKDYFLGSKSQVTLYKGHLGVGVTEPSGQLELAGDERIQEYPPGPMSGYETMIPGHGVFCAYGEVPTDSVYLASWPWWKVFDESESTAFHSKDRNYDSTTPFAFNGQTYEVKTKIVGGSEIRGEFVDLKCPYEIMVKSMKMSPREGLTTDAYLTRMPSKCIFVGSNDGTEYEILSSHSGIVYSGTAPYSAKLTINATKPYKHIRLIITHLGGNGSDNGGVVNMGHLRFFGTPGPTTLDKGSLSLTRSLDVPRVSRYDVDTETPRPEKLVVDFDTTVNSSPTDISGRGNHGVFYGTNMNYSSADKAFAFNGTDDYIKLDTGLTGNVVHSISMWVKAVADFDTGNIDVVLYWGAGGSGSHRVEVYMADDIISYNFASNDYNVTLPTNTLVNDRWYHLVFTYNGVGGASGREVYIDGVKQTGSHTGSTDVLTLANSDLYLASNFSPGGQYHFGGQISNFKLYNVALEPSEVQKLYRLGRTGRSMVISDTAVGIGKVPEAQLDVRGVINADTIRNNNGTLNLEKPKDTDFICGRWTTTLDSSADTNVVTNLGPCMSTQTAPGSGMSGSIGRFTAPHDGYYHAICQVINVTGGVSELLIVYDASGTNFATNNPYPGTYSEIIDLRSRENVEQCYNFVHVFHMEKNDYIQFRVHSSSYTDGTDESVRKMDCSVHLLNRI